MSSTDNKDDTDNVLADICANCGESKENTNSLKACTACKMVKYCGRECQIAHRPQHKKACKKRAAELHDELLFKRPPPEYGDCPICFIRMPSIHTGRIYMTCCGKMICSGCVYAPLYDDKGNEVDNEKCPFCRTPDARSDEDIGRMNKRVDIGDIEAICIMGLYYANGMNGLSQDYGKALGLWHRAGEHGHAASYNNIGTFYCKGDGVTVDKKKAKHYWELAAMRGCTGARYNVGVDEANLGNNDRALKHWMIAVESGHGNSLTAIQELYADKHATKEDYANALRAYQAYLVEIKSDARDAAAAANDSPYYE